MKNIKINKIVISVSLIMYISLISCTKNEPSPTPFTPIGTLQFHLHTNVDTNKIIYSTTHVLTGGRKISVSKAQLYISGIQLVKLDGSVYDVTNTYLLITNEAEIYTVGNVPVGNYKSVKFYIGLDATTNQKTPFASDSLLNKPDMWFGTAAQPEGYVFLNFQGTIDTASAATGISLIPFSYKIGTNVNRTQVSVSNQHFTVLENKLQLIHMTVDYAKLLEGINLRNSSNLIVDSKADNAKSIATKLTDNMTRMFRYED